MVPSRSARMTDRSAARPCAPGPDPLSSSSPQHRTAHHAPPSYRSTASEPVAGPTLEVDVIPTTHEPQPSHTKPSAIPLAQAPKTRRPDSTANCPAIRQYTSRTRQPAPEVNSFLVGIPIRRYGRTRAPKLDHAQRLGLARGQYAGIRLTGRPGNRIWETGTAADPADLHCRRRGTCWWASFVT